MDGVILVYDVTDESFPSKVKNWMDLIAKVSHNAGNVCFEAITFHKHSFFSAK